MFWVLLLIVLVLTVSVAVMLGEIRPMSWASISAMAGLMYAYILDMKTSFVELVLEPGIDTWSGLRYDIYGVACAYMLFIMVIIAIIATVNIYTSWRRGTPIGFWQ
jgi:hypothetical protein